MSKEITKMAEKMIKELDKIPYEDEDFSYINQIKEFIVEIEKDIQEKRIIELDIKANISDAYIIVDEKYYNQLGDVVEARYYIHPKYLPIVMYYIQKIMSL